MSKTFMRRATRSTSAGTVKVTRFNQPTKTVEIDEDTTVEEALEKAGIELTSGEEVWINGEQAGLEDYVDDGDILQVVGKMEAGV